MHFYIIPIPDGTDFSVSAMLDIPMESSGDGLLAPASFEACFNVTIFGDDLVENSPETVSLRVMSGATQLVDINVNIQDDDSSKLQYSQSDGLYVACHLKVVATMVYLKFAETQAHHLVLNFDLKRYSFDR